jgi:negative regulator of sigma-B (phosphoserine phosphatase)
MEVTNQVSNNHLLIEWGVATRTLAGHAESGDQYLVKSISDGVLVAVVDGLGHGDRAAEVAKTAVATMDRYAHEPVISLIKRCHESLRGSRGVVMSLASFNVSKGTMTWLGVGNVDGMLLHADARTNSGHKSLILRGGVVGYRLPTLRDTVIHPLPGDILIFFTDGIRSGFIKNQIQDPFSKKKLDKTKSAQQLADYIMAEYGRETDDALVLVARYKGVPSKNSN